MSPAIGALRRALDCKVVGRKRGQQKMTRSQVEEEIKKIGLKQNNIHKKSGVILFMTLRGA